MVFAVSSALSFFCLGIFTGESGAVPLSVGLSPTIDANPSERIVIDPLSILLALSLAHFRFDLIEFLKSVVRFRVRLDEHSLLASTLAYCLLPS